ncbi:hypothetical protein [Salinifilum ghardaiensis]
MDPHDRADEALARARARDGGVVTPDNATSPMDAEATVRLHLYEEPPTAPQLPTQPEAPPPEPGQPGAGQVGQEHEQRGRTGPERPAAGQPQAPGTQPFSPQSATAPWPPPQPPQHPSPQRDASDRPPHGQDPHDRPDPYAAHPDPRAAEQDPYAAPDWPEEESTVLPQNPHGVQREPGEFGPPASEQRTPRW